MNFSNKCWCCLQEKGPTGLTNLWSDALMNGNPENYGQMLADGFGFNGSEWKQSKDTKICLKCATRVQNSAWFTRDMSYLYGAHVGVGTVDTLDSQEKTADSTDENIAIKDEPGLCDKVDSELCVIVEPDFDKVDPELCDIGDPDFDKVDPELCDEDLEMQTDTAIANAMAQYLQDIENKQVNKEEKITAHNLSIEDKTACKNTPSENSLKKNHKPTKKCDNNSLEKTHFEKILIPDTEEKTHFETILIPDTEENLLIERKPRERKKKISITKENCLIKRKPQKSKKKIFNTKEKDPSKRKPQESKKKTSNTRENYLVERTPQQSKKKRRNALKNGEKSVGVKKKSLRYYEVFTDYEYLIPIEENNSKTKQPLGDKLRVQSVLDAIIRREINCQQAAIKLHTNVQTILNMLNKIGYRYTRKLATKRGLRYNRNKRYSLDQLERVVKALKHNRITIEEAEHELKYKLSQKTLLMRLTEYKTLGYIPETTKSLDTKSQKTRKILEDVVNDRMSVVVARAYLQCSFVELQKILLKEYGYGGPLKVVIERMSDLMKETTAILAHTTATPIRVKSNRYCCLYCSYIPKGSAPDLYNPTMLESLRLVVPNQPPTAAGAEAACAECADNQINAEELRVHTRTQHADLTISEATHHFTRRDYAIRLDIADLQCKTCPIKCKMTWTQMFEHLEQVHSLTFNQAKTKVIPYDLSSKDDLECVQCQESFKSSEFSELNIHMNTHYFQICTICNITFKNSKTLKLHQLRVHEEQRKFICNYCSKTYTIKCHIAQHLQSCNAAIKAEKRETIRREKIIKCLMCYETFPSNSEKAEHFVLMHGIKETYPCIVCSNVFAFKGTLRGHYKRIHPNAKFDCKICDQVFDKPYLLKWHEEWHNNHEDYVCNICGVKFNSKKCASIHKRTHEVECTFCDAKFKNKQGRSKHWKSLHPAEWIAHLKAISIHKRTHEVECTFCDAKFKYKKNRSIHWKSLHPAEWIAHLKAIGRADRVDAYLTEIKAKGEKKRKMKYPNIVNIDSEDINKATNPNYAPKDSDTAPEKRKNTDPNPINKSKMVKANRAVPMNEHSYALNPLAESGNLENPAAEQIDPNIASRKRKKTDSGQHIKFLNTKFGYPENTTAEHRDLNTALRKRKKIDSVHNIKLLNTTDTDHEIQPKVSKTISGSLSSSAVILPSLPQTFLRSASGQYCFKVVNSSSGRPTYVLSRSTSNETMHPASEEKRAISVHKIIPNRSFKSVNVSSTEIVLTNAGFDKAISAHKATPNVGVNVPITKHLPIPNSKQYQVGSDKLPLNHVNTAESDVVFINKNAPSMCVSAPITKNLALPIPNSKEYKIVSGKLPINQLTAAESNIEINTNMHGHVSIKTKQNVDFVPIEVSKNVGLAPKTVIRITKPDMKSFITKSYVAPVRNTSTMLIPGPNIKPNMVGYATNKSNRTGLNTTTSNTFNNKKNKF